MRAFYGLEAGALIAIHGGAGPQDPTEEGLKRAVSALRKISSVGMGLLRKGTPAIEVAVHCLQHLEDDPQFNAGLGSALQADGLPRLSASVMDGAGQKFSGVIAVSYVKNPSALALALQDRHARVLTHPGHELLARELRLPVKSNLTPSRCKAWNKNLVKGDFQPYGSDTVGVVIRDFAGKLVAASSTGGRGFEFPGRVSDTATVAGNYASRHAAVCVTGHGEEIVDDAVAARLESRVRDGMPLAEAAMRGMNEAKKLKRRYGWIALSEDAWSVCYTSDFMPFVVRGEKAIVCTLNDADKYPLLTGASRGAGSPRL